jgi:hypothetical protein
MPLHFTPEEFRDRQGKALQAMAARGLDALLMFKQENGDCSGLLEITLRSEVTDLTNLDVC